MSEQTDALLRAVLATLARSAFPVEQVQQIVGSGKQLKAFNSMDGTRRLADIAKSVGLDSSNLRKAALRWMEAGIVFRVSDDGDARYLHAYPLPEKPPKGKKQNG